MTGDCRMSSQQLALNPIATLTFSGGETIKLEPEATVVFVGPNNVGKSQALRDINTLIVNAPHPTPQVVTALQIAPKTSPDAFLSWLKANSRRLPAGTETYLHRVGGS